MDIFLISFYSEMNFSTYVDALRVEEGLLTLAVSLPAGRFLLVMSSVENCILIMLTYWSIKHVLDQQFIRSINFIDFSRQ
jgi:hypothetical protein